MTAARRGLVAGAALVAVLVTAQPAWALFTRQRAVTGNVFVAGTLQPAANLTLTRVCPGNGLGYTVTIAWTASPSTFVKDYRVEWADDVNGAPGPWTVIGTFTSSPASETGVSRKTDNWYRVRAQAFSWTSTPVQAYIRTPGKPC
jgi:hypothetical protein